MMIIIRLKISLTQTCSKSMTTNISTDKQERRTLYAAYITDGELKGSKASVAVYEPEVKEGKAWRHSGAMLYIKAVKQLVSAGWFVDQDTYGDRHARLSFSWRDDKQNKECVDLICPGFVQVSSDIARGMPVSTYNGKQHSITITIFQDRKKKFGYWPKSLLPGLSSKRRLACWTGTTHSPPRELAPPMGSGHFPSEGYGKSAFFNNILIMDENNNFVIPNPRYFRSELHKSKCYQLGGLMVENTSLGFYFGGPGAKELNLIKMHIKHAKLSYYSKLNPLKSLKPKTSQLKKSF
ncbi:hypothetical protein LUZ60_007547 [Juncus effusus]|nr:hypothetical protein LUZ60_007547 [Juncus effusus]